jgi:glutamyl-Q tRNA(Asp) synthetase
MAPEGDTVMTAQGESSGQEGIVTRFAPSPTGRLHLGHAVSALKAHDFARARGGRFLLRIEDIDGTRSRPEHVAGILEDLAWLGLEWDGPVVFQSQRLDRYQAALDRLQARGLLYPCFCTRAEIAAHLSAPHGVEGAYPGICRGIDATGRLHEPHAWRLDVAKALEILPGTGRGAVGAADGGGGVPPAAPPAEDLCWHDSTAGTVLAAPQLHGDVVLARKDAPASYHLAVTLDDAAQGITDVVRGVDLFEATHVHRLLQALLGLPTPRYHHHPLLTDAAGQRLAKRHGASTLADLRASGADGRALAEGLRAGQLPIGFGIGKD